MIVDPVRRAIGSCHSGWKGTVGRIGEVTVRKMQEEFGSDPKDLVCAIGPSICRDCYEISEDVAARFKEAFPGHEDELLTDKHNGHYQLDLWKACRRVLLDAGVPDANIFVTDVCTCCNPDVLFSHRATGGKRGNIAGFIALTGVPEQASGRNE
jgi:YfiH family protein